MTVDYSLIEKAHESKETQKGIHVHTPDSDERSNVHEPASHQHSSRTYNCDLMASASSFACVAQSTGVALETV